MINYIKKRKVQKLILENYVQAIEHISKGTMDLQETKAWLFGQYLGSGLCYFAQLSPKIDLDSEYRSLSKIFYKSFISENKRCDGYGQTNTLKKSFFCKVPACCEDLDEILECLEFRKAIVERAILERSLLARFKNFLTM